MVDIECPKHLKAAKASAISTNQGHGYVTRFVCVFLLIQAYFLLLSLNAHKNLWTCSINQFLTTDYAKWMV